MVFIGFILGLVIGLGSGESNGRKKSEKKLGEFVDSRGLRLLDRDGNEIPTSELIAAIK